MTDIEFERPDGKRRLAYLAEPEREQGNRRSIVVLHEMWGLSPTMRSLADQFAAAGYRALVPDLFDGERARNLDEGFALMGRLDPSDAVEETIRGAARWLGESGGGVVGVAGFCLGGALAIRSALHLRELSAAVCFYGIPREPEIDPAKISIPLLGHFAQRDTWCTPSSVDALEARLRAGDVAYEIYRYDEDHAFMNPEGPGYSPASAVMAWRRTIQFLDRNLIE